MSIMTGIISWETSAQVFHFYQTILKNGCGNAKGRKLGESVGFSFFSQLTSPAW